MNDEVNARGEMTFAEQTRLLHTSPGSERLAAEARLYCEEHNQPSAWCVHRATPDDDPWYDVPPGPPVLPEVTSAWNRKRNDREGREALNL